MGKRSRNAEMEREIAELKRQLVQQSAGAQLKGPPPSISLYPGASGYASTVPLDQWNGSHEAVAGLLDLRSGVDSSTGYVRSPSGPSAASKRIEGVVVSNEGVAELFQRWVLLLSGLGERMPDRYPADSLPCFIHFVPFSTPKGHRITTCPRRRCCSG